MEQKWYMIAAGIIVRLTTYRLNNTEMCIFRDHYVVLAVLKMRLMT